MTIIHITHKHSKIAWCC